MAERKPGEQQPTARVTFEGKGTDRAPALTFTGGDLEQLRQPERIQKLMEALGLPKGTKARVVYTVEDVIVR
jgi:hypothetical protein